MRTGLLTSPETAAFFFRGICWVALNFLLDLPRRCHLQFSCRNGVAHSRKKTKMISRRFTGKDLMTAIFSPAHRFRVILARCGLVALLAGCGAPAPVAVTPGPAPTIRSSSEIDLPLMAYRLTIDNLEVIQRGVYQQQVACAARYGVTITPEEVDRAALKSELDVSRRYGLVNRSEVEQYGYRIPPSGEKELERDPSAGHTKRDEVLTGQAEGGGPSSLKDSEGNPLPEGGCAQLAWNEMREPSGDGTELAQKLLGDAWSALLENETFKGVEKDWAACMKKAGYDFQHRWEAGNSVGEADAGRQREMALKDLGCAEETNYVGRAMAVDVAIQKKLISENEASLRAELDVQKKVLERAKEALR